MSCMVTVQGSSHTLPYATLPYIALRKPPPPFLYKWPGVSVPSPNICAVNQLKSTKQFTKQLILDGSQTQGTVVLAHRPVVIWQYRAFEAYSYVTRGDGRLTKQVSMKDRNTYTYPELVGSAMLDEDVMYYRIRFDVGTVHLWGDKSYHAKKDAPNVFTFEQIEDSMSVYPKTWNPITRVIEANSQFRFKVSLFSTTVDTN